MGVHVIVGLDLSLNGSAVVAIPEDWRPGAWRAVKSKRFAYGIKDAKDPKQRAERLAVVSQQLVHWIDEHAGEKAYVEDYAYGRSGRSGLVIAEMGGAVKASLFRWNVVLIPVNISTARKYFLGKLPQGRGKQAPAVHEALIKAGCRLKSGDERDALIVCNYALTEYGRPGLTLAV